ncbi:hypothetical protein L9F63_001680, partial [Diploptera punctata]
IHTSAEIIRADTETEEICTEQPNRKYSRLGRRGCFTTPQALVLWLNFWHLKHCFMPALGYIMVRDSLSSSLTSSAQIRTDRTLATARYFDSVSQSSEAAMFALARCLDLTSLFHC